MDTDTVPAEIVSKFASANLAQCAMTAKSAIATTQYLALTVKRMT